MLKSRKYQVLSIIAMIGVMSYLLGNNAGETSALSYTSTITQSFTFSDELSISLSSDSVTIENLIPTQNATSATPLQVTVTTNNPSGYKLISTVGNSTKPNRDLVNTTNQSSKFTSLAVDASIASPSGFSDNTWGFQTSTDGGSNWSAFSGLPLYNDNSNEKVLRSTSSPSAANGDILMFKIGAKAGAGLAEGTYTNVVNFIVTTNPNS